MPRKLPLPKGNEKLWLDLLPPVPLRQHGRHIYVFRNIQTNQILYTLFPRIEQRTLRQLPFIGKHSQPPRVRPDHWTAHCRVGPFPTAKQGLNALKKLREFRKLHELSWDRTNPEWKELPKKKLIRSIMAQRENTAADLAKVLFIQEELGMKMAEQRAERTAQQDQYLDKKWASLEAAAKSVEEGKIQEMEQKIRDHKSELSNQKPGETEALRLNNAISQLHRDIKYHLWAQHIVQEGNQVQQKLDPQIARFNETKKRRDELLEQGKEEEANAITLPKVGRNHVRDSLLPKALKSYPKPYSLNGIECHWADLWDAEFAQEWPEVIVQSPLVTESGRQSSFITEEEYNQQVAVEKKKVQEEAEMIVEELRIEAENRFIEKENRRRKREGLSSLPTIEAKPTVSNKEKTGIAKYIPAWASDFKNPFKRASP